MLYLKPDRGRHDGVFCHICGQKSKKSDLRYLSHLKFILAYETMTNQDPKGFFRHFCTFWDFLAQMLIKNHFFRKYAVFGAFLPRKWALETKSASLRKKTFFSLFIYLISNQNSSIWKRNSAELFYTAFWES